MAPVHVVVGHTWDGDRLEIPAARLSIVPGIRWQITVDAPFHADPPPPGPPGPTDRLWEHEVVELFLVGDDERYTEIELGPHGHHLVLQLHGVRKPVRSLLPVDYRARIEGHRWHGEALVEAELLPGVRTYNAFAIHGVGEQRRYCAAFPVPGPAPDFHRLSRYAPWPG